MSFRDSFPDFACVDCGSPGIRVDGPLCSSTDVRCGGCGKRLCAWSTFVAETEQLLERGREPGPHERSDRRQHSLN
jgi:hypothetical protein